MGIQTPKYYLPRGRVYLYEPGSTEARHVQSVSAFSLAVATTTTTQRLYGYDGPIPQLLCEAISEQTHEVTGTLTASDMSAANVAAWLGGTPDLDSVSSGSDSLVVDPVAAGVWYLLNGATYVTVTGVVADQSGALSADEYEVDAVGGLVRLLVDDYDGEEVTFSYTLGAAEDVVVEVDTITTPEYSLRYVSDVAGCSPERNHVIDLPLVRLSASAEWLLTSPDTWASLTWDVEVLKSPSDALIRYLQRVAPQEP